MSTERKSQPEAPEDIATALADQLGIHGAHAGLPFEKCESAAGCRSCFIIKLADRMRTACMHEIEWAQSQGLTLNSSTYGGQQDA